MPAYVPNGSIPMDDARPSQAAFFSDHPRSWRANQYVYPVISRRSGGLSIGINLNPDKACNFDCIYCQVDRTVPPQVRKVDIERLRAELERTIEAALSGDLFADPQFSDVPDDLRRINDMAFSGDGEPTASPHFKASVELAAAVRQRHNLTDVKLVLITDAAFLHRPPVREALALMDQNNGEIWAKLDAGTERYYQLVNRPNVPLQRVLDNLLEAARIRPVVIQSLWMNVRDEPPPQDEIVAFAERLKTIIEAGGRISLVQLYTVARKPAEPWVSALPDAKLEGIADRVRQVIDVPVVVYGS
jgi:wyosine [tRNA(Phe)-imidazoG37] synthetase (radical SAM superfamily)